VPLVDKIWTGVRRAPRRTFLYGVEGIGKSTFGAQAPLAVIQPTEDGLNDIACGSKLPKAESFDEVMANLAELYTEPHEFKTYVLDTLDWLEVLIWQKLCKDKGVSSIEEFGYGKGYLFALEYWRQFRDGLDALRNDRGMSIILLAHAKIEKFQNPETDGYDRYQPKLHKLAAAVIQEWCDEVLFAGYKVHTREVKDGFKTVKKGVGTSDGRIIRTTERPYCMAKNRLGLPEEIPFSWDQYAAYLED